MAKKRTPSENLLAMIDSLEMQKGQARADISAEIYNIKQMMNAIT
jgi:hypothetical protein